MKQLLSISQDAKTIKGEQFGYLTGILYLAPSNESAIMNTCPFASKGCRAACLFTAGRGEQTNVRNTRINKTVFFKLDRDGFMATIAQNIEKLCHKAKKRGLKPAVRLNGTSDLPWHEIPIKGHVNIMAIFPHVQFYDYTAVPQKAIDYAMGKLPANYHVTFSKKESNDMAVSEAVSAGTNVAVVFATPNFPKTYLGRPVVSGDTSDLRFLDGNRVIVGLKAKGKARKDTSGFVVNSN